MVAPELAPSPELVEANRRLYELRERVRADKALAIRPGRLVSSVDRTLAGGQRSDPITETRSLLAGLPAVLQAGIPAHLGWGSTALTNAIRASHNRCHEENNQDLAAEQAPRPKSPAIEALRPAIPNQQPAQETVKLYPDIALGMLRKELEASGRIWLLLRYLDQDGRGWLQLDFVQEKLTAKNSDLRVCGRRQLRNLLKQGGGVFWDRDKDKVWLKSAAKVAAALDVERLSGHPVELPIQALLGGIRQIRAHFYASFHSGRRRSGRGCFSNPITRTKLEEITQVPERTQRVYEQAAGVISQKNIAVGEKYSDKEAQEKAWQHGRATFKFIDREGKQGPAGQHYVAWRLPNCYIGCHDTSPKGRQKKINNRLNQQTDLVNIGAQGNGLERADARFKVVRLFHSNGLEAGKAYNRNGQDDSYWPAATAKNMSTSPQLWQVVPGGKDDCFLGRKKPAGI